MMKDTTVSGYLAALPADRRREIAKVRAVIRKNIPKGYVEHVGWGGITWSVPLEVYPDTYNGHPLSYVAIASQKNYASLYLMVAYGSPAQLKTLTQGFAAAGKKLDMGKSCIRFQSADDLALDVIGKVVASVAMPEWIALAKAAQSPEAKARRKVARAK
jgi:uncharacterized protein YdhG (YjbR/CyaY superfamily)